VYDVKMSICTATHPPTVVRGEEVLPEALNTEGVLGLPAVDQVGEAPGLAADVTDARERVGVFVGQRLQVGEPLLERHRRAAQPGQLAQMRVCKGVRVGVCVCVYV
jgi:hypothetical protein